jgi:PAS domain S-box-containing protein
MNVLFFLKRRLTVKKEEAGYSYTTIADGRIVLCTLHGYITRPILDKVLSENRQHTDKLTAKNMPALLATDIRDVTGVSAEARSDVKNIQVYETGRSAVFGANPFITLITQYVLRMSGNKARFFKTKRQAVDWLLERKRPLPRVAIARTLAIITGTSGVLVLYGWAVRDPWFQSLGFVSELRNPVTALCLLMASVSVLFLTRRGGWIATWFVRISGLWLMIFGSLVGIRAIFDIDTLVDGWLFSSQYVDSGSPTTPTIVALAQGLVGVLLLLATTSLKNAWAQVFRVSMVVAIAVTLYMLVQQGFGIPEPKIIAACGALLSIEIALILITHRNPTRFPIAYKFITRYWSSIIIFVLMFTLTVFAWQQAKHTMNTNNLNSTADTMEIELNSNFNILHGYKALFRSSDFVNAVEFDSFFTESGSQNYPGMSVLGFLQNTTTTDEPSYPVTYLAPQSIPGNYGLNLADHPATLELLNKVRDSGTLSASDHAGIPSITPQEPQGLFVAEAIYTPGEPDPATVEMKRENLYGFVVAQFSYQKFFENFFQKHPSNQTIALIVTDDTNEGSVYYQSEAAVKAKDRRLVVTRTIHTADHPLNLSILAESTVATSFTQGPDIVLLAGTVVSFLLSVTVALLVRRRHQALKLAELITQDLEKERSDAVAAAQKDDAILAGIGDGLVTIDDKGIITLVNDQFRELFELEGVDVRGKNLVDVAPMFDNQGRPIPLSQRPFTKVLRHKKKESILMRDGLYYRRGDGSTFPAAGTMTPIAVNDKVVGAIGIIRDITAEANIDRAKTEFVSLASHQLRTPLTAAKWYSELLLQSQAKELTPEQREYAQGAYGAVVRTIKLVSSLLNLSRLEMGSIAVEPEKTDITKLSHDLVKELAERIAIRHQRIKEMYPAKVVMNVDPRLVRIMIENLLTNAIKYTPEHGIIEVSIVKSGRDVLIEVRDTGYGIPKEQQDKIFTKLFRADNIRSKTTEGVGLGLYLTKSLVQYSDGEIWFESVENEGTTFHIRLPASGMKQRLGKEIIL